jgi:predicted anti-sigma-YlaC factor YlaD
MRIRKGALFFLILPFVCFLSSCSINRMAVKAVSNALTGEGSGDVFTGDPDPELVGDALPFAIKVYETLLSQQPDHQGLILTTGSLFIMYANAFVQGPAQMLPSSEYEKQEAALSRAKKLYLRGTDILLTGLEKRFPGFIKASVDKDLEPIFKKAKKQDVPLLYWTVAGLLSAYALDPFDISQGVLVQDIIPLIHRAYELDPDYNHGAIDDFYVLYYASMPEGMGGDKSKAETHFRLALEKSGGALASPYVSYAQTVAIPAQDYESFKMNLEKALEVNPDDDPSNRLVNILAQRKARFLLDSAVYYFAGLEEDEDDWEW